MIVSPLIFSAGNKNALQKYFIQETG